MRERISAAHLEAREIGLPGIIAAGFLAIALLFAPMAHAVDTDGDGIDNLLDLDDDNDGILDGADRLSVTINGATYDNVVVDGSGNWSIDTGTATVSSGALGAFVDGNSYSVTATVMDAAGNATSDLSTNELVFGTADPSLPTVDSQTTSSLTPTITGTATVLAGETLTVEVNDATYTFAGPLTGAWSVDLGTATPDVGTTLTPLVGGTYQDYRVTATVTTAALVEFEDATTKELVIATPDAFAPTVARLSTSDTTPTITGTATLNVRSGEGLSCVKPLALDLSGITANVTTIADDNNDHFSYTTTTLLNVENTLAISGELTIDSNQAATPIGNVAGNLKLGDPTRPADCPDPPVWPPAGPGLTIDNCTPDYSVGDAYTISFSTPVKAMLRNRATVTTPLSFFDNGYEGGDEIRLTAVGAGGFTVINPRGDMIIQNPLTYSTGDFIEFRPGGLIDDGVEKWSIVTNNPVSEIVVQAAGNRFAAFNVAINESFCSATDSDGDTILDHLDLDSDNDGIADIYEAGNAVVTGYDVDGDGHIDASGEGFVDATSNGLDDRIEGLFGAGTGVTPVNTDSADNPDYLDLDSDNDGIPDATEARATVDYTAYSVFTDGDGDGILDVFDNDGILGSTDAAFKGNVNAPNDDANDADSAPDYLDLDSDGDGNTDATESDGPAISGVSYADPDGNVNDPLDSSDGSILLENADDDTTEVDFRSRVSVDTDGDGVKDSDDVDDDNDGILDVDEGSAQLGTAVDFTGVVATGGAFQTNHDGETTVTVTVSETTISPAGGDDSTFDISFDAGGGIKFQDSQPATTGTRINNSLVFDRPANFALRGDTEDTENGDYLDGPPSKVNQADADLLRFLALEPGADFDWNVSAASFFNSTGTTFTVTTTNVTNDTLEIDFGVPTTIAAPIRFIGYDITVIGSAKGIAVEFESTNTNALSANNTTFGLFTELFVDTDGDGIEDHLDLDSDNDGIADMYEAGNAAVAAFDVNGNGYLDASDGFVDTGVLPNSTAGNGLDDRVENEIEIAGSGVTPVDSFTTDIEDYLDLDSDDDGIPDATEARATGDYVAYPVTIDGDADSDDDGILDIFDSDGGAGPGATTFGSSLAVFKGSINNPNDDASDSDGLPDYLDTDSDGDGIDDDLEANTPPIISDVDYTDPDGNINDPLDSSDGSILLENADDDPADVDFRSVETDDAPTISVTLGSDVLESTVATGTVVGDFTAADEEGVDTVLFTTSGTTTSDDGYYTIDGTDVELTLAGANYVLAGNTLPAFSLTVTDTATPTAQTASANATPTTTLDVDDAPTISVTLGSDVLESTVATGTVVGDFTAADEEGVDTVLFTTSGTTTSDDGYYTIDGTDVELTLAGANYVLAGNTLPAFSLTVTDTATPTAQTASANATPTTTLDVDDAPTISVTLGSDVLESTVATGTVVGDFTAADEEGVDTVLFTTSGTTTSDDGYYTIDGTDVELTLAGANYVLAGNTLPAFSLTVTDTATPTAQTASVGVAVSVTVRLKAGNVLPART